MSSTRRYNHNHFVLTGLKSLTILNTLTTIFGFKRGTQSTIVAKLLQKLVTWATTRFAKTKLSGQRYRSQLL